MGRDGDPSGTNGPSSARRGAGTDGSNPEPRAGAGRTGVHAADLGRPEPYRPEPHRPEPHRPEPYCAVTIVCGPRRLDVALPTAVCVAELLPGLLRLMLPGELPAVAHDEARAVVHDGARVVHDEAPAVIRPWALIPIGGNPLAGSETLAEAGILAGDLLSLEQHPASPQADSAVVMTRDRIEDVMNGEGRFWGSPASRSFAHWTALLTGAAMLLPAVNQPAGPELAAMSATVALIVALTAVLSDRRSEKVCAAVGLVVGCCWAGLAGAAAFQGWAAAAPLSGVAVGVMTLLVGTGSALLLAAGAAAVYPTAVVHAIALLVVGIACAGVVVAVNAGVPAINAAWIAALLAALVLGGLPRLALATGGLTESGPSRDSADLDHRIHRADRVLIGCLVGVSIVAAGAMIPSSLSNAAAPRLLAVGIGLLLLLRSRAYSQRVHVLAPRVGGLLVFGVVWLGAYRDDAAPKSVLILGAVLAVAALVVGFDVLTRAPSPVGHARRGRLLDLAEQLLVVALIVLMAWVVVLANWVMSVIG